MPNPNLKSLLPWIGWASLVFADEWYNITLPSNEWGKYEFIAPHFNVLLALLVWVVSLALIFSFLWKKTPSKVRPLVLFVAILLLGKPLFVVREMTNLAVHVPILSSAFWTTIIGKGGTFVVLGVGTLALLFFVLKKQEFVGKVFLGTMLLFSPTLPVATLGFLVTLPNLTQYQPHQPTKNAITSSSKRRVIWMIFDELDQELVFESSKHSYPNFKKFAANYFTSTHAFPPGPNTKVSLPAYIHQKLVFETNVRDAVRADLRFGDQTTTTFGTPPHVFSKTKEMGFRTALAGWFHPYCRVLGTYLDKCWWGSRVFPRHEKNLLGNIKSIGRRFTFPQRATLIHRDLYTDLHKVALEYVAEDSLDLVFLHLPVPHRPCISTADAKLRRFSPQANECYFENVALADKLLGDLLSTLEKSDRYENSLIILSSDHPWRAAEAATGKATKRVPLAFKLPGLSQSRSFSNPINTVGTGELSLRFLAGEVKSYQDAEAILSRFTHSENAPAKTL